MLKDCQGSTSQRFRIYSLNGESLIEFPESNKAEDFITFLKRIKESNEKRIVVILDNFGTHHAKKVREEAEKLNISLIYLPPYYPDLNPIERKRGELPLTNARGFLLQRPDSTHTHSGGPLRWDHFACSPCGRQVTEVLISTGVTSARPMPSPASSFSLAGPCRQYIAGNI